MPPENDQRFDDAGIHVAHQFAERADLVGGPCVDAGNELDRLADVAEGVVDQMRQRVNLGWLRFAGNDQTLAAMGGQVARQRGDPAGMAGERGRESDSPAGWVADSQAQPAMACANRAISLAPARPAGDRPRPRSASDVRLDDVQPVHRGRRLSVADLAPLGERRVHPSSRPGPHARKSASSDTITSARSR